MKNRQEAKGEIACIRKGDMCAARALVERSKRATPYVLHKVQLVLRQYTQLNLHSSSTGQIGESV